MRRRALLLALVLLAAGCGGNDTSAEPSPGPQCESYELDPEECPQDQGALEGSALHAAEVDWVSRSLPVWAWTIDDPDEAQALVAAGVTGIITDVPDVISEALAG